MVPCPVAWLNSPRTSSSPQLAVPALQCQLSEVNRAASQSSLSYICGGTKYSPPQIPSHFSYYISIDLEEKDFSKESSNVHLPDSTGILCTHWSPVRDHFCDNARRYFFHPVHSPQTILKLTKVPSPFEGVHEKYKNSSGHWYNPKYLKLERKGFKMPQCFVQGGKRTCFNLQENAILKVQVG